MEKIGSWNNILLSNLDGTNGFRLDGEAADNVVGGISSAGDINDDGVDDFIISAPMASLSEKTEVGCSYVIFGHTGVWNSPFDLSGLDGTNGFKLDGENAFDHSGSSVSDAGDINGDGIDDIIIGAVNAGPLGMTNAGRSYVVFGHTGIWNSPFGLSNLDGNNGFKLDVNVANELNGFSVSSAGDINNDGLADIVIGASNASPSANLTNAGRSYVVFGHTGVWSSPFDLSSLDGTNGFKLDGEVAINWSGFSVSDVGDVNGDSIDDLVLGAPNFCPSDLFGSVGRSYVIFGHAGVWQSPLPLASLDGFNGFKLDGEAIDGQGQSGWSVSGAGDINGDGIKDIIIGDRGFNGGAGSGAGRSYIYFGHTGSWSSSIPLSSLDGTDGFKLDGETTNSYSGYSVTNAGDINGDGIEDALIGAYGTLGLAGRSYVIFGAASGPTLSSVPTSASSSSVPIAPTFTCTELFKNGISPYDYLRFSDMAYYRFHPNILTEETIPSGWKESTKEQFDLPWWFPSLVSPTDINAIAFTKGTRMVVAFFDNVKKVDIKNIFNVGIMDLYRKAAISFTQKAIAKYFADLKQVYIRPVDDNLLPDDRVLQISFTGSELGGDIATLCSALTQRPAVVFNSVGTLIIMQLSSGIYSASAINYVKQNAIVFNGAPNKVNTLGNQVGRVYRLYPSLQGYDIKNQPSELFYGSEYNLGQIINIYNFNSTTGCPKVFSYDDYSWPEEGYGDYASMKCNPHYWFLQIMEADKLYYPQVFNDVAIATIVSIPFIVFASPAAAPAAAATEVGFWEKVGTVGIKLTAWGERTIKGKAITKLLEMGFTIDSYASSEIHCQKRLTIHSDDSGNKVWGTRLGAGADVYSGSGDDTFWLYGRDNVVKDSGGNDSYIFLNYGDSPVLLEKRIKLASIGKNVIYDTDGRGRIYFNDFYQERPIAGTAVLCSTCAPFGYVYVLLTTASKISEVINGYVLFRTIDDQDLIIFQDGPAYFDALDTLDNYVRIKNFRWGDFSIDRDQSDTTNAIIKHEDGYVNCPPGKECIVLSYTAQDIINIGEPMSLCLVAKFATKQIVKLVSKVGYKRTEPLSANKTEVKIIGLKEEDEIDLNSLESDVVVMDNRSAMINAGEAVIEILFGNYITGKGSAMSLNIINATNYRMIRAPNFFTSLGNSSNIVGTFSNEHLIGDWHVNAIYGLAGDDILEGRGNSDILDGGSGNDTVTYCGSAAGVNINLGTGLVSGGDAQNNTLLNIENIDGSLYDDILVGDEQTNTLRGGFGNDLLEGKGGDQDILDGGDGSDTTSYANSKAGVNVDLETGLNSGGEANGDKLFSIENIIGSAYNDNLIGDLNGNILQGKGGNDVLNGNGGFDTLIGGNGADTFIVPYRRGTTVIADFNLTELNEKIDISAFNQTYQLEDLSMALEGNGTVIAMNNGMHNCTIDNIAPGKLRSEHFKFYLRNMASSSMQSSSSGDISSSAQSNAKSQESNSNEKITSSSSSQSEARSFGSKVSPSLSYVSSSSLQQHDSRGYISSANYLVPIIKQILVSTAMGLLWLPASI